MIEPIRIIIVGPGRAGISVGLAFRRAGHEIVGVLGRSDVARKAAPLEAPILKWDETLPVSDLVVIAVSDDAIEPVAGVLAEIAGRGRAAVHMSGLTSVGALSALARIGMRTGGFHPLQTMPNPQEGVRALAGAAIGITADGPLLGMLERLARDIGANPFPLDDSQRPLYHAAAAAAANYVLAVLGLAEELFAAAGVPFAAARPLVAEIVANAFDLGPRLALTGPIARGDVGTVQAQIAAVGSVDSQLAEDFKAVGRATARLAGASAAMREVLELRARSA
jgi:predicted short-subunit dehydrogenase-like oxidoreductase (DUF2520 family)